MQIVYLPLEIVEVGIELHFPLVQVIIRFLSHLCDYNLELIEHHLHSYNTRHSDFKLRDILI